MAINLAARRGEKNQRRKAAVAQKRKAELEAGTIAGRVRLAQTFPIQHCLLTRATFEVGMGTLVVARGATPCSAYCGWISARHLYSGREKHFPDLA